MIDGFGFTFILNFSVDEGYQASGYVAKESNTTEIFTGGKWVRGPDLPEPMQRVTASMIGPKTVFIHGIFIKSNIVYIDMPHASDFSLAQIVGLMISLWVGGKRRHLIMSFPRVLTPVRW